MWLSPNLKLESLSDDGWLGNRAGFTTDDSIRHTSEPVGGAGSMIGPVTNSVDCNNLTCWSAPSKQPAWVMYEFQNKVRYCMSMLLIDDWCWV